MAQASPRMARKKEETKQKIITAALGLFREQGFDATTMESIAEAVDIAKGTLYNYFPVKEAILDEYIRRGFRERNAGSLAQIQSLPDTRARMGHSFAHLLAGVQAQPVIFEKYVTYRMQRWISFQQDEEEKSGFHLLAAEIVRLGQQSGELRRDLPAGMLEDLCEYAFMLAVKAFYLSPESFSAEQAIGRCVDVFINGAGDCPKEV
ncbi:MAG: TetR/AcrR family transcriptional regulator [Chloroflexota bacterium]